MSTPFERSPEGSRRAYPLERAHVRWKLIRELAGSGKTQTQLAEEYGVSTTAISQFKARHLTAIEEQARDQENAFSSLWVAEKGARLAELQDDIEQLADLATDGEDLDAFKIKHAALMQVAKELGQIPSSAGVKVDLPPVTFKIEGVDLTRLT